MFDSMQILVNVHQYTTGKKSIVSMLCCDHIPSVVICWCFDNEN